MNIIQKIKLKVRLAKALFPNMKIGVFVLSSILAIVIVLVMFKKQGEKFDAVIEAKDETIQHIQLERASIEKVIVEKNKAIKYHEKREIELKASEARLLKKLASNEQEHKSIKKAYEKIPITVNNLSKSELREQIANFED